MAILSSMPAVSSARSKPKASHPFLVSIGAAAILAAFWILVGSQVVPIAVDFKSTYRAAEIASKGEYARLYDAAVIQQQDELARPVVRPQFYAFLTSPLARFPYQTAFRVWLGIQISLLLCCWIWALRRFGPGALIWGTLSAPTALGIFHGQDGVLMLAIMVGGYALAKKKMYWAAGAVLALALMKFHLVLLLAPAMLLGRRWKMFGGFAGMGAVLVAWCVALGGTQGLENYWALLGSKHLSPTPDLTIGIQGLLANLHADSEILHFALGLAAVGVAAMVLKGRQPLWRWMSLSITVSLFAAPHVYSYDAAIMVLPVWLVQAYSTRTPTRIAFAAFATPVPFLAGLAGPPWSIVTPLCLAACFGMVVWEAWTVRRTRVDQMALEEDATVDDLTLAEPAL